MNLRAQQTVDWSEPCSPDGITPQEVYIGSDPPGSGFQVAVASASVVPSRAQLSKLLAHVEAALGTGEVLPRRKPSQEVVLTDKDLAVEQMEDLLETRGSSAALSGEENRRRLFNAVQGDIVFKHEIIELPYGVGSGFENPRMAGNGYVFCINIANHDQSWFRYVPVDDGWNTIDDEGTTVFQTDTLACLIASDPGSEEKPCVLDDDTYTKDFSAWEAARDDVFATWQSFTDVNNLKPEVPRAFRDVAELVVTSGSFLGRDSQRDLVACLGSVSSRSVSNSIRSILNNEASDKDKINAIQFELNSVGIKKPPAPEPLPKLNLDEVRLVAWMVVKGTAKIGGPQ